ncbi:hypothetical protein B0T24DRAFT_114058 [Lasiosphaeria ovina]|uniref:Uncharacterized protein n=1 Tax=Lasiosphaeria ovina TaxID=92902 RepID=A0AAE0MXW2_9PEZI|nr:hypothetical protein B0T24DRAFT_200557 [Lasiosphaeria ovina]KAK3361086.1 hypothetical protein B0T24DRAFT_114058 [Lasiosphaeria ovina]
MLMIRADASSSAYRRWFLGARSSSADPSSDALGLASAARCCSSSDSSESAPVSLRDTVPGCSSPWSWLSSLSSSASLGTLVPEGLALGDFLGGPKGLKPPKRPPNLKPPLGSGLGDRLSWPATSCSTWPSSLSSSASLVTLMPEGLALGDFLGGPKGLKPPKRPPNLKPPLGSGLGDRLSWPATPCSMWPSSLSSSVSLVTSVPEGLALGDFLGGPKGLKPPKRPPNLKPPLGSGLGDRLSWPATSCSPWSASRRVAAFTIALVPTPKGPKGPNKRPKPPVGFGDRFSRPSSVLDPVPCSTWFPFLFWTASLMAAVPPLEGPEKVLGLRLVAPLSGTAIGAARAVDTRRSRRTSLPMLLNSVSV